MKPSSKKNPKNLVLPHSQAKLDLYAGYIERYVQVLVASQKFQRINIYDVFCGAGIYDDGKPGSPIFAFEAIKKNREWCRTNGKYATSISLTVNDGEPKKVNQVKEVLAEKNRPEVCDLHFHNLPADEIFETVVKEVNGKGQNERNLVFIDPYGYKDIRAVTLNSIMQNGITEIILFLPVSFLYRFADTALTETEKIQYEHLRNFIFTFFPETHPFWGADSGNIQQFIRHLRDALSFDERYFSASYYIQRDAANYFAIFFISSNILGLEKFLETRWQLDLGKGEGFKLPDPQGNLFARQEQDFDKEDSINQFAEMLEQYMREKTRDNKQVYEFSLRKGFLPKHSNEILRQWLHVGKMTVWDIATKSKASVRTFFIKYEDYKQPAKVSFKLN
jgi:three-Cys-motif partner protein